MSGNTDKDIVGFFFFTVLTDVMQDLQLSKGIIPFTEVCKHCESSKQLQGQKINPLLN